MKIAKALSELKRLKGRLSQLFALSIDNQYHPEQETPEFSTAELLGEWDEVQSEVRKLSLAVQRTNQRVKIESGKTLAEAILTMADLRSRAAQYERIIKAKPENKYMRDEKVIYAAAVPVPELVEELNRTAKEIRRIDEEIQEANWRHELLE